ncbi:MAG TPA: alanine racemase [Gemmatimonadaceae bacterium]|nr:alanine racemase [Gemmatimonadaceae bacterium]
MKRAWVEIDLGALRQNAAAIAQRAGTPLLPMVKADGYGLGAVTIARALEQLTPWGFGVATISEGVQLREAGIERHVVVFTPLLQHELADARRWRLTPCFGDALRLARWHELGGARWQLSIDTGMNRDGVRWDQIDSMRESVLRAPPEGAFTHLHSADLADGTAEMQERRFEEAISRLPARPPLLHAENSAMIVRRAGSPWNLARPGIFIYGGSDTSAAPLHPLVVMKLRARIVDVRTVTAGETVSYGGTYRADGTRRIATVAMGYADGYPRSLSNRGEAIVRGCRVPVAGIVNMDMTMVDVTNVPCDVGDVATFIGSDGDVSLSLDDVARRAGTISYEVLTGLGRRLERVYAGGTP